MFFGYVRLIEVLKLMVTYTDIYKTNKHKTEAMDTSSAGMILDKVKKKKRLILDEA